MALKLYNVIVNSISTILQLNDEDAKLRNLGPSDVVGYVDPEEARRRAEEAEAAKAAAAAQVQADAEEAARIERERADAEAKAQADAEEAARKAAETAETKQARTPANKARTAVADK